MPEQQLQTELLELTKDLIRIPSTHSRQHEINRCAQFIVSWLSKHNIQYEIRGEITPSIVVLPQPQHAPLLLMTHFDVVEANDISLFQPTIENGNLYGRGAVDDKYGVALSLILFREHLKRLIVAGKSQNHMQFGLLFTGDEEVGGSDGAGTLAGEITADFFIAIDGGRPDHIVTKEKGIIRLQLIATGKAAHSARPWMGKNAFDILMADYQKIQKIFSDQRTDHWHKTAVLTNCKAGNGSANIVPDKATAQIDIRYTDHDDPEELIALIRSQLDSKMAILAKEPVFHGGVSPYLDLLVHHSENAAVGFDHGASDARYFSQCNIPGAIWGAESELSQHTEKEHIVLSSLFFLYDRLDSYLLEFKQLHKKT